MSDPLGPVYVGAREIYDMVVRVGAAVDRVADQLVDLRKDRDDHESRLRSLEKARWPLPSLALIVSLAAIAIPFVSRI